MIGLQLALGALTLVTNAFFVGGEFALVSVRRSQIEPRAETGDARARTVLWGLEHVSAMLATAQLGVTVSSLALGAVAEPAIAHLVEPAFDAARLPESLVHPVAFAIALAAATYLHMLIGEMVPKNLALAAPDRAAMALVPPLVALTRALRPLIFGINALANSLLRLGGVEPRDEVASAFTDEELARIVEDSGQAGLLDDPGRGRLRDALELGTRTVTEVLVPNDRMVTVEPAITPRQLERTAAASGYSRFPVVGSAGVVSGFLHVKDSLAATARDAPFPRGALHPVVRLGTDTRLDDALAAMRAAGTHLAAVTGDTSAVAGYVTMEDVLQQLVGPPRPTTSSD